MARAQGARAQMALAFETVYGTPPGAGYTQMPFITSSLAAEQPLLASELLGYGRDPRAPLLDAITTDGDVEVPIDAAGFGFWLKAAFGAPTTAGTVAATGSITFSAQPAVNSTLTINGTAFTFVASGATGNQVNIGANLAATLTAMAVALNSSVVPGVALATYTGTATALTIVHDTLGSTGNTFSLAASITPASNGTVSAATLTGGLNAHTFLSGNWALPSMSIEVAMPEVPRFAMYSGCVLDSLSWQMERSGLLGAKAMLVAQGETIAGATAAGTPAAIALKRFGHFNGAVKRDGFALGNIVSADLTYANNLDRIETIRSDGKIDGADPGTVADGDLWYNSGTGTFRGRQNGVSIDLTGGSAATAAYGILQANYTLTSVTTAQKLFNWSTNGALSLAAGTYRFSCSLLLTSMSSTSGSAKFDLKGAGSAVFGKMSMQDFGSRGTVAVGGTTATSGTASAVPASAAALATAATSAALRASIHGTFEITTAGTIIPSIALDVAAAAVVNAGSYFECIYLGPAAALGGSWS